MREDCQLGRVNWRLPTDRSASIVLSGSRFSQLGEDTGEAVDVCVCIDVRHSIGGQVTCHPDSYACRAVDSTPMLVAIPVSTNLSYPEGLEMVFQSSVGEGAPCLFLQP